MWEDFIALELHIHKAPGYTQSMLISFHGWQVHKDNQVLEEKKRQLTADCSKEKLPVMQQSAGYQQ